MKFTNGKPLMAFGMVFVLGIMIGAMIVIVIMPGYTNIGGSGMWGIMALPSIGFVLMLVMMIFFFRGMTGGGGLMAGMMGQKQKPQASSKENKMNTLTYTIPSVSCAHCKMTIEREISELPGVASVTVEVDTQQAVIQFDLPATKEEIEALLAEIGYPAENQAPASQPAIQA